MTGGASIGILWLRRDLRLGDHPALAAALAAHEHVVPVFCFDKRLLHGRHRSGPRTQFLLECLADRLQNAYVRRYLPELRDVPDEYMREPWTMPPQTQSEAGCLIGEDYPEPIVDHKQARIEALERYRIG